MLSACAALNPFRLDDQVALFHDDLRWGRMPAAESAVDSSIKERFTRMHAAWGRSVHIIDVDLEGTRVSGINGTVRAHYIWTRDSDVAIRETVVETSWRAGMMGSWKCEDEHVVSGDATLINSR